MQYILEKEKTPQWSEVSYWKGLENEGIRCALIEKGTGG